ncbi:hypothetical protein Tco_0465692 [Tanacetum coccineum]
MLLMALPSEHLLTFSQYKDAKTLFEAIQARFGSNDAIRKTQKTLLKQMYENFNASSIESLDSIFNRLQKIISQLDILDLDIMSFDDLYNNFKIVEQEVKRTVSSSSNLSSQNVAFVSSPSSTNEVNTANIQVSTTSTPVTIASLNDNTANLSDANVYTFLANKTNGSQLVHEDLEQIHDDDLEEMDLKWQLALLSMRAKRYYQRSGKKITINRSDTAGYDKNYCYVGCHVNGILFQPVPRTTSNVDGTSTSTIPGPVTIEEKTQKKNDVKARSMLLMALPNEHLLTFSQYKDAKTLFEAIQARFGSNDAIRKTQKTLLKQMYENFNASSIESLDSIFNRH